MEPKLILPELLTISESECVGQDMSLAEDYTFAMKHNILSAVVHILSLNNFLIEETQ